MKLKLTLVRAGGDSVDVAVTAEPTSTIGDIARAVHNADPRRTTPPVTDPASIALRAHRGPESATLEVLDATVPLTDSTLASGAVISLAPASSGARRTTVGATITIAEGPDAGRTITVPPGSSTIGRDARHRVALTDPLVSKTHARLNVTDLVEIIDSGSANGTFVNDQSADRAVLVAGDRVTVGDTVFTVVPAAHSGAVETGGIVQFNRSPRLDPPYLGIVVKAPEPPEKPRPARLPYLALLAPLILGAVLFFVNPNNLLSIVFIALSPLLMVASFVDNLLQTRRAWKQARADFFSTVDGVSAQFGRLHEAERTGRLAEAPALAEVLAAAASRGPLLWTRRPEHDSFLLLRLGLGRMPSRHSLEMPTQRKGPAELWDRLEQLRAEVTFVEPVPVVEVLPASGSLGVAGPLESARGVARGVVAQLVALHSPAEVVVAAIASTQSAAGWDWLKWLPHVGSAYSPIAASPLATSGPVANALVSELEEIVEARGASSDAPRSPTIVLIIEDDAPVERARLVGLAERGPQLGVHLIWVAASLQRLPAACRTFVELNAATGLSLAGYVRSGAGVQPVSCDQLDVAGALAFARSLSPVVDAGARVDDASDLPRTVSLLTLIGTDAASDAETVVERWQETHSILSGPRASTATRGRAKPNLRAVFGQSATEPFALDLRSDGPHALVGGTTGSGKSEFLQAWVLGLAAAHSPQRVAFLFVDYKGGAAFAECVKLPHTVGLVTDLSPHLVRRALTSLRAELRYREHLFNRKKVKDIVEFERTGDPEVPPSLVIVVDEFAALASEVPEFVDGVVDVAQRGRSLGLHLILATQRPAGVIRDNLRANTNLRVALRVADEADSTDVLGTPMAAGFDPAIPGRAAAKTGPGRIRVFQSGYASGWTSDVVEPTSIAIEELLFGLPTAWEQPADPKADSRRAAISEGPTDIARIVSTVQKAAGAAQLPAPRKPWLPELAALYDFSKLPNKRTDTELVLGVVDDAATQSQPIVSYLPDRDGNMAIVGTGGSGKSTALRTLAVSAAITARGGPVHVYGLDFAAGGLQMLESLPHVGSIVSGDDEERVARLLRGLRDLVDQRAVRYSEARAGGIVEYRKIAGAADEPRILLLLDGMGAFREAYETAASAWFSVFSQIAIDGRSVGVHVVVTGDRAGAIPLSLSSSIQRRLVLRMATGDDYGMLGVPGDVLNPLSPPGRGILDGLETQLAVLGGDPNMAVQARELDELAASMIKAGITAAPPIERLAEWVRLDELPAEVGGRPTIGVADDSLAAVGVEATGSFLISGPPGSGRTTALLTLATSFHAAHPEVELALLSPRRSPLAASALFTLNADELGAARTLAEKLATRVAAESGKPLALFIENVTDFTDTDAEDALERLVTDAIKRGLLVVGEAETSTWAGAYSLGKLLKSGRRGILLQPDDGDDELLKADFGRLRRGSFPPGRGFLVTGGRWRKLQVATTDEGTGQP